MKKEEKKIENFFSHRKYRVNFFLFIVIVILMNISFYSYDFSLSFPTYRTFIENSTWVVVSALFSTLLTIVIFNLILFLRFSRKMKLALFVFQSFFVLEMYYINQGSGEDLPKIRNLDDEPLNYGFWVSRACFYVFLSVEIPLLFSIYFYRFFVHVLKIPKKFFVVVFLLLLSILGIWITFHYSKRREVFNRGLFGERMIDSKSMCKMNDDIFYISQLLPKNFFHVAFLKYWCFYDPVFTGIVENSPFSNETLVEAKCRKKNVEVQFLPNIHHYSYEELKSAARYPIFSLYQRNFLRKIERKELKVNKKTGKVRFRFDSAKYETILVKCGNKKNIVTAPKASRVNSRKIQDNDLDKFPSIYLILVDSESRKNFEYDFPLTIEYMNKIKREKEVEIVQFFNHHAVGYNTFPQTLILFNGANKQDEVPIWESAMKRGYLSVYTYDECNPWSSRYNLRKSLPDYVHLEPFCFEEYTDPVVHFRIFKGPISSSRRCLFQYEAPKYVFEYMKKIDKIHKNKAKIVFAGLSDAHEATGESVRYTDKYLLDYMQHLHESGIMQESIIVLFSDHGNHVNVFANLFKEGRVGGMHAMLNFFIPTKYLTPERTKNLESNKYRLVTFYDVHKTLVDLMGITDKSLIKGRKNAKNLIEEIVPFDRTCSSAGIFHHECSKGALKCEKK